MPRVALSISSHLGLLLGGLAFATGLLAACSDDDPGSSSGGIPDAGSSSSSSSSGGSSSSSGGSSSSSSSSSSSGGTACEVVTPLDELPGNADAAGVSRGIFFTHERYRADFAAGSSNECRAVFVDNVCQRAAVDAGLRGRYRTVLAIHGPNAVPDLGGYGAWCAIQSGAPSCTGDAVIFPSADAFTSAGPSHALTTDQEGASSNPDSTFLSGVTVGHDDGLASSTCTLWTSAAAGAEAGVGTVEPAAAHPFATWTTAASEPCDEVELPLLCVQVPPTATP